MRIISAKHVAALLALAGLGAAAVAIATGARPAATDVRNWSASVPVAPFVEPSLQSGPSIAVRGDKSALAFTDSRNSGPDIYANVTTGSARAIDTRISNSAPRDVLRAATMPAVTVETSGRAFAAFVENSRIYLARYDIASNSWLSRTQVSPTGEWYQTASAPSIAGNGSGALLIAWEDYRGTTDDDASADVYVRRCDGNTLVCGAETKLNSDAAGNRQLRPRVALNGAVAAVVWEDYRERGNTAPRIFGRTSVDGGVTWAADARVNKNSAGAAAPTDAESARQPAVTVAADGTVVAAWEQATSSTAPADIMSASFAAGIWSTPQRVDGGPVRTRATQPSVAASAAGVFVAWADFRNGSRNGDIYAAKQTATGWAEAQVTTHPGMQVLPAIDADGATVRLVWQDDRSGGQDVFGASWNGTAWASEALAGESPERAATQIYPSIANGNGTYGAFFDMRNGFRQIWLAQLEPAAGAPAWRLLAPFPSEDKNGNDVIPTAPSIASGAASVHATWVQWVDKEGDTVMHASYSNGAWSEPRALSIGTGVVGRRDPVIAVRDGAIGVAWTHYGAGEQHQVYAAWLKNGTWSAPTPVLAAPKVLWNTRPNIAFDAAGRLHVAYSESDATGRGKITLATRDLNTAGGWTYKQITPVLNADWCAQANVSLQTDSGAGMYAAWTGCTLKNPPAAWPHEAHVLYSVSSDNGNTWSAPVKLAKADADATNRTVSRPALAVGNPGEALVIYPAPGVAGFTYYGVTIKAGVPAAPVALTQASTNWIDGGEYAGEFYSGDGRGAVGWDGGALRFVTLFPDRRNGRTVSLTTASYGEAVLIRTFLPLTRR